MLMATHAFLTCQMWSLAQYHDLCWPDSQEGLHFLHDNARWINPHDLCWTSAPCMALSTLLERLLSGNALNSTPLTITVAQKSEEIQTLMVAKSYNSPRHSAIQVQMKTSVTGYRGRDVREWDARNLQGFVHLPSSVSSRCLSIFFL